MRIWRHTQGENMLRESSVSYLAKTGEETEHWKAFKKRGDLLPGWAQQPPSCELGLLSPFEKILELNFCQLHLQKYLAVHKSAAGNFFLLVFFKFYVWEDLQDGKGVRCVDHLHPHRYIRNTSICGTTPTEHLLNDGRRSQTSQKARNPPHTWVGQKKKRKNRDKRIGTGLAPLGGICEGGKLS